MYIWLIYKNKWLHLHLIYFYIIHMINMRDVKSNHTGAGVESSETGEFR